MGAVASKVLGYSLVNFVVPNSCTEPRSQAERYPTVPSIACVPSNSDRLRADSVVQLRRNDCTPQELRLDGQVRRLSHRSSAHAARN
jgi:hypothetical protein